MSAAGVDESALHTDLEGASNVLLLAPAMHAHGDESCMVLLTPEDPETENVLSVSFTKSPDDWMARWRTHGDGSSPNRLAVVSVGDQTRSAAAAVGGTSTTDAGIRVESVGSPSDLTSLGVKLTQIFGDWEDDDEPMAICFDSLTALLQYADLKRAFRFLHVLTGRLSSMDAVAHYHLDPTAHDQQTVNTLMTLFDAVVELEENGTLTVRRR